MTTRAQTPSPKARELAEQLRRQQPVETPTVEALRAGMEIAAASFQLLPDVVWQRSDEPGLRGEWVATAASDPERVLVHVHGGAFVAGSASTYRELAARLARAAGARVFTVDYALAPERPFPAALEDVFGACRALLRHGLDPRRLAIVGDDAGATIALTTVAALRDAGEPLPAAAACLSPWVDLAGTVGSRSARAAEDPVLRPEWLERFAALYLGDADPNAALASVAAIDLHGFPPLLVQVGSTEILHDDAAWLVERAREHGVSAELEVWDAMVHVWHLYAAMLPEGRDAIRNVGRFLRAVFDQPSV